MLGGLDLLKFHSGLKIVSKAAGRLPVFIFFFNSLSVWGQLRDTSLHTLFSHPFYYNVVQGGDGKIYAGTSEGIFQFEGASVLKINDRTGYLTLDRKGRPVIDFNGIKYHEQTTYVRLLPFPQESRNEYHAGTEDFFYITSAGRMHIYQIRPFDHRYRNHSVRTASRNFVGTYSGVYYRGKRLDPSTTRFPNFVDGRIREINGKVFVCYSSLFIADLHQGDSLPTHRPLLPKGYSFDWASDILYSERYDRYFMSAKTELVLINSSLTEAKSVFTSKSKEEEVVLLGENRSSLYMASGKDFIAFGPLNHKARVVKSLPEQILDGHISNLNHYLLCSQGLYVVRANGSFEKLTDLRKAHTLLHLGGSEYAISTDAGLFSYNVASNKLSALIQGVEFNRRGLYLEGDSLFAGSIDGLYVLDAKNLDQLAARSSKISGKPAIPSYLFLLIGTLAISAVVLSILLYRSRRRLTQVKEENQRITAPKLTREDIETFIKENLAKASLKSIAEKFDTSNAVIYQLLAPEKPGALINRLRMEQVKKLREEKRSAREISEQTGFSEYYVRKVWNTKE